MNISPHRNIWYLYQEQLSKERSHAISSVNITISSEVFRCHSLWWLEVLKPHGYKHIQHYIILFISNYSDVCKFLCYTRKSRSLESFFCVFGVRSCLWSCSCVYARIRAHRYMSYISLLHKLMIQILIDWNTWQKQYNKINRITHSRFKSSP
jgi:hypothetical protein